MWELKFDDGTNVELGSKILDDKGRPGTVATVKFFKSGAILIGCDNGLQVKRDKGDLRPIRKPDSLERILRDIDDIVSLEAKIKGTPCYYFHAKDYDGCRGCKAENINFTFKDELGNEYEPLCIQKMLFDIRNRIEAVIA